METIFFGHCRIIGEYNQVAFALVALPPYFDLQYNTGTIKQFDYFLKIAMCDTLRNLVLLLQFKKRENHPWRSVTFSKVAA